MTRPRPVLRAATAGLLGGAVLAGACSPAPEPPLPGDDAPTVRLEDLPADRPWLEDVARESGIDFAYFNGMSGAYYFAEIMGAGGGLLDYDGDGDLDVYLVQGSTLDGSDPSAATPPPGGPLSDRLYRNDGPAAIDGATVPVFTDVTGSAGLGPPGYGMGVAAGDFDHDGRVDVYVTRYGPNVLLRNRGDGTFEDVTAASGADDPRWSTSAAFVDYDRDGWLDLFVCNYVDYRLANHKPCVNPTGAPDYCAPGAYAPVPDRLLRNRGDGTFEDVSLSSRIALEKGAGLGVVVADYDGNGWPDIYVANDQMVNHYWVNQGDGTFRNEALLAGVAVNASGNPEASMGIDAGDFDGDGDDDLFMTHLRAETNTLYVNDGHGTFTDRTIESGIGPVSKSHTGFGTTWFDLNNDGWLDLFVANGAVTALENPRPGDLFSPYRETNQLLVNLGNGQFADVSRRAGAAFETLEVSRGASFGDVDNDGDVDLLVVNNSGPARLLLNRVGDGSAWIGFRVVAGDPPRDALGARVAVDTADGRTLWRRSRADASYCSANDPRVHVGLGGARSVSRVRVFWPDGTAESWDDPPVGRWTTLVAGSGAPTAAR